jgi:ribosome-associated protein
MIEITKDIFIDEGQLVFKASRSGGPGGQNVFDVAECEVLSDIQKRRILARLSTRADKNGIIRVVSQKFRTQKANRRTAVERLQELLKGALKTKPVRKKTKVPERARLRRLEEKKRRSILKRQRAEKNYEF